MAIHLNPSEEIRVRGQIHWFSFFVPAIIAVGILGCALIVGLSILMNNPGTAMGFTFSMIFLGALAVLPLLIQGLRNKCTVYLVTNQRVFIQKGILSRFSSDIPLEKINDVSVTQSLLQRICGTGTVTVLTGNDIETDFDLLANVEEFRSAIRRK